MTDSLRWRGNGKQRFKAARVRARQCGHWTGRDFRKYGDPGDPRRYTFWCSCGVRERHLTESDQILAERDHVLLVGRK